MQTSLIQNAHADLVTDAAYDFYGVRLATCSLDHRIKIWQLDESDGTWTAIADWKVRAFPLSFCPVCDRDVCGQAHDAAVTKLSWAHPEFGSVLASSSFDRTVKIWEEIPAADNADQQPQANGGAAVASGPGTRWVERAVLADAKGSVRAVEFAPHQFGLKLVRACYFIIFVLPSLRLLLTGSSIIIGCDCFGQSPARVRVPRGACAHKLDSCGRGGRSLASGQFDIPAAYLCGTYTNSDRRNPSC
jgi:WD domain, G-beta repeat